MATIQRTPFPDIYNYERNMEESHLWSSFADVMILIVIIFLMIITISTLRNFSLAERLEVSSLSEKKAQERIQEFITQQSLLEKSNEELQRQLLQTRSELTVASSMLQSETANVSRLERELKSLRGVLSERELELQDEIKLVRELSGSLEAQKNILKSLELALSLTETELQEKEVELEASKSQFNELLPQLETAVQQRAQIQTELDAMQLKFDELQTQYDKLVRPARTSANKYIISVRYFKQQQRYITEIEESPRAGFRRVSTIELHNILSRYKAEKGEELYTRIIIPEDSNLNFNEAWNFQLDILSRYDYYYQ